MSSLYVPRPQSSLSIISLLSRYISNHVCRDHSAGSSFELVFIYFMYVETRGPTLEELAKVIDGDEAEVELLNKRHVEKDLSVEEFSEKN